MDEEIKKEIRKMTLQNAFEHEGETRDKIMPLILFWQFICILLVIFQISQHILAPDF